MAGENTQCDVKCHFTGFCEIECKCDNKKKRTGRNIGNVNLAAANEILHHRKKKLATATSYVCRRHYNHLHALTLSAKKASEDALLEKEMKKTIVEEEKLRIQEDETTRLRNGIYLFLKIDEDDVTFKEFHRDVSRHD